MSLAACVRPEFVASWYSFLRRRAAVFLAFFLPVIIIVIFGALVQTQPTGGGLFAKSEEYYIAGYLVVVVLFAPLSRVGSAIAHHRDGNRFGKLATTPLSCAEWLLAYSFVNVVVIDLAALLLLVLSALVTDVLIPLTPATLAVVPFVALGVTPFCGLGAATENVANSQDGVIAASNAIVLPLLLLSGTLVTPDLLPAWFILVLDLLPFTYFARGVQTLTYGGGGWLTNLTVFATLVVIFSAARTVMIPRID